MRLTAGFHKYDNMVHDTLILNCMNPGLRKTCALLGLLLVAMLAGPADAASIGTEWKERPYTETPFSGVIFSDDGSIVWAGGEQMIVRVWDGQKRWGGRAGSVAAMSTGGEWGVDGIGNNVVLFNRSMVEEWTRTMDGAVKAVAISKNGSLVISADGKGNYNAWAKNGEFLGRAKDDVVKQVAISPAENLVVATTEAGMRIYTPTLDLVWADNKSGSLDTYIVISGDSSTIITAGGNRLSSHTGTGKVNWVTNPSAEAISDIACNYDCSFVIVGSQDGTVQAIDRYGKTHWSYKAGQWINAVAVSQSATITAAGGLDGTIYLLDRSGTLLTRKKLDSNLRPRSLAITHDGRRIAAADLTSLWGLSVMGDADPVITRTFTVAPLDPVRTTAVTTVPVTETIPAATPAEPVTTLPQPQPTAKSSAGLLPAAGALAAAFSLAAIRK